MKNKIVKIITIGLMSLTLVACNNNGTLKLSEINSNDNDFKNIVYKASNNRNMYKFEVNNKFIKNEKVDYPDYIKLDDKELKWGLISDINDIDTLCKLCDELKNCEKITFENFDQENYDNLDFKDIIENHIVKNTVSCNAKIRFYINDADFYNIVLNYDYGSDYKDITSVIIYADGNLSNFYAYYNDNNDNNYIINYDYDKNEILLDSNTCSIPINIVESNN